MSKALQIVASHGFSDWLSASKLSLAFTTYRMGKLFLLGSKQSGQLSVFERTFNRSMGVWSDGQTMWLAGAFQIWRLENMLPPGAMEGEYDRLFVPMQANTTGDISVHDVTVDRHGQLHFASTLLSCVGQLGNRYSLMASWKPPFISQLVPEDRCHLNGLCCDKGVPRYVTACAPSDTDHGWRAHKRTGGCVLDMETDQVIADGLSMPHSPRVSNGKLWLLNSGRGELGFVHERTGRFEPVAFCPGFARGLAIAGDHAIVGLSKPRDKTFVGLELDAELERHDTPAICGLIVVDLARGTILHQVHVLGEVDELYDVVALPGVRCPKALGLKTSEIQRNLWLQAGDKRTRFTASENDE